MTTLRRWSSIVALPLGVVLSVALALAQFFAGVRADLEKNVYATLTATAKQQIATILARLEGKYNLLEGVAHSLPEDAETTQEMLRAFVEVGEFALIGIVDENGNAVTSAGLETNIADRAYFRDALAGKRAIDHILQGKLVPEPRTILAIPLLRGGKRGVLYGSFPDEAFASLLQSDAYSGQTRNCIIDASGSWITKPEGLGDFADLRTALEGVSFSRGENIEAVFEDLRAGRGGTFTASSGKSTLYVRYELLGVSDWFLFSTVPSRVIDSMNAFITERVTTLSLELVAVGFLSVLAVAYIQWRRMQRLAVEKELLRQSEERYRLVEAFSDSVLFEGDLAADTFTFNPAFQAVFGRDPTVRTMRQFTEDNPNVLPDDMPIYLRAGRDMLSGVVKGVYEFRFRVRRGGFSWHRLEFQTQFDEAGQPRRVVGKLVNIERQKRELERLKIRADQDSLTKLYNREAAKAQIDAFLKDSAARHAFMILDIDDFKRINDEEGHMGGDRALVEFAGVLRKTLRATDILSRLGGDEFVVLVKDIPDERCVRERAEELLARLLECERPMSCSIGAAIVPEAGDDFDTLYACADRALYRTKMLGKHGCTIYRDGEG